MSKFEIVSNYKPAGDQPAAINELVHGLKKGVKHQVLLGVTGSGKTYTMSNVIQQYNRPTLIISHNKTLAAQLYSEFKSFFPNNAVEFFISYYDYYQPEAYVVKRDLYIEKDFSVNEEIDRLRLKATTSLIEGRNDVIIVASVSCIYGIGAPEEYARQILFLKKGQTIERKKLLRNLIDIYYTRNDAEFNRGTFRARGDVVEIIPAYQYEEAIRIEFWGDEIERLSIIDSITGDVIREVETTPIYPAKYFVTTKEQVNRAIVSIDEELRERLKDLWSQEKYVEAQRLEQRTKFDIEMMREIGYCSGIENYSRHMDARPPGSRPYCLFDYFPKDYLLIIDECSTVSNKDMRKVLEKAKFTLLVLVGDIFQIESILFGNWFSIARSFVPGKSVFELTKPYRSTNKELLSVWDRVRKLDDAILEPMVKNNYTVHLDDSIFDYSKDNEIILCLNYDGLYGINNINRFLQGNNKQNAVEWGINIYKINDPILFNESERFAPLIYNNMKGKIIDIEKQDKIIRFDIELDIAINELQAKNYDFDLVGNSKNGNSIISFWVNKYKSTDEDDDSLDTIVPFQISYAISIHKAQGLEYNSVKIVITNEVEERITHNIFYTAITRAKEDLKIYWTPETEKKVLNSFELKNITKDVALLKTMYSI